MKVDRDRTVVGLNFAVRTHALFTGFRCPLRAEQNSDATKLFAVRAENVEKKAKLKGVANLHRSVFIETCRACLSLEQFEHIEIEKCIKPFD